MEEGKVEEPPIYKVPEEPRKSKVYLDIMIGGRKSGRIIIDLRYDVAPRAAEKGSKFHRVTGVLVQGGDITKGDGTGGKSIYGETFDDETKGLLSMYHLRPGIVSMANFGPNTNGSQFFITRETAEWLDGKYVIFGNVYSGTSIQVIERIARCGSKDGKPRKDIVIYGCGEILKSPDIPSPWDLGPDFKSTKTEPKTDQKTDKK